MLILCVFVWCFCYQHLYINGRRSRTSIMSGNARRSLVESPLLCDDFLCWLNIYDYCNILTCANRELVMLYSRYVGKHMFVLFPAVWTIKPVNRLCGEGGGGLWIHWNSMIWKLRNSFSSSGFFSLFDFACAIQLMRRHHHEPYIGLGWFEKHIHLLIVCDERKPRASEISANEFPNSWKILIILKRNVCVEEIVRELCWYAPSSPDGPPQNIRLSSNSHVHLWHHMCIYLSDTPALLFVHNTGGWDERNRHYLMCSTNIPNIYHCTNAVYITPIYHAFPTSPLPLPSFTHC